MTVHSGYRPLVRAALTRRGASLMATWSPFAAAPAALGPDLRASASWVSWFAGSSPWCCGLGGRAPASRSAIWLGHRLSQASAHSQYSRFVPGTSGQRFTRGLGTSDAPDLRSVSGVLANPDGKDGRPDLGDICSSASEADADRVRQRHRLADLERLGSRVAPRRRWCLVATMDQSTPGATGRSGPLGANALGPAIALRPRRSSHIRAVTQDGDDQGAPRLRRPGSSEAQRGLRGGARTAVGHRR